ncbi:PAS domain S-box protein [Desulfopila sp. IMCC35008]|uniref:PAS domain S-box protein n=1 Tax=Desulfopila sp. IMCC35008 TaxID=2653858 RepID=UPI0013D42A90|nr:PAS domain S-box protein [Desulfopila sp. IMCC35008]
MKAYFSSYAGFLIVRSIALAILPLIILSSFTYWYLSHSFVLSLSARNELLAQRLAGEISALIGQHLVILQQIKYFIETDVTDNSKITAHMETIVRNSETFETIYLLDAENRIDAIGLPAELTNHNVEYLDLDMSGMARLELDKGQTDTHWSDLFLSRFSGVQSMFIALDTGQGKLIGVFTIAHIRDLIRTIQTTQGISLMVTDHRGDLIFADKESLVEEHYNFSHIEPVRQATSGVFGTFQYRHPKHEPQIGSTAGLPHTKWVVVVSQNQLEAQRSVAEMSRLILLIALLLVPLIIFLAVLTARKLHRPLKLFETKVKAIASGDYTRDLEHQSFPEVESLASHIRVMASAISQREQDLVESEERYRLMAERTGQVIYDYDVQTGNIDWYGSIFEVTGYTANEMGKYGIQDWRKFIHKDDAEHTSTLLALSLKDGTPFKSEYRYRRKNGSFAYLEDHGTCLTDDAGKVFRMLGNMKDISERKQIEEALLESEERFRMMMHQAPSVIELYDADGLLVDVNQAYEELWGFPAETTVNTFNILKSKEIEEIGLAPFVKKAYEGEIAWVPEYRFDPRGHTEARGAGRVRWLSSRIYPLKNSGGEVKHIVITHEDITEVRLAAEERKMLETQMRQTQKMEAIGTLAGGIAHDFNNILSAIFGYTQLARMTKEKPDRLDKALDGIYLATDRAKKLVKQILAFSRQDTKSKNNISLSPLGKEVAKLVRQAIPSTIDIHCETTSVLTVHCDPTQLHQVIMNLCTNAYQAMRDSKGILELKIEDTELTQPLTNQDIIVVPVGTYVAITVRDTGYGMDKDMIKKIFEPYFTTKEIGEGTGLGLAVVHGIVNDHNGYVNVSSIPGKGSEFTVYLPASKSAPTEIRRVTTKPSNLAGTENVLFIDDESPITSIVGKVLPRYGYRVTTYEDPQEALDHFLSFSANYDILITDMTMPKLTGMEIINSIRKKRPELPVILCTGYSEKISENEARYLGVDEYLEKPFPMTVLLKAIRNILDSTTQ